MEKQLEQLSCFINRVASDVRLKPTHTSVYVALCDSWIGSQFSETFQVSRKKLMRAVYRDLSQGDQRASGIRLLALLTFLPSFEGKRCDLTRNFIDLKPNGDDLGRTLEGFYTTL